MTEDYILRINSQYSNLSVEIPEINCICSRLGAGVLTKFYDLMICASLNYLFLPNDELEKDGDGIGGDGWDFIIIEWSTDMEAFWSLTEEVYNTVS